MNKKQAISNIVEAMVNHGFMRGFVDDDTKEYREEQKSELMRASRSNLAGWLEAQEHNICKHCGCEAEWEWLMNQ